MGTNIRFFNDMFTAPNGAEAEDENMMLFIGRLTWVKGVRNLVQAMPSILSDYPKTKLVILGKGEEQKDVSELASRLGIEESHQPLRVFPEPDRIAHYAVADVCVFPSIYEPFGIVSLEAMSMAKLVVGGGQGVVGFKEQVMSNGSDQNGAHVNGNNPADIAWGEKTDANEFCNISLGEKPPSERRKFTSHFCQGRMKCQRNR